MEWLYGPNSPNSSKSQRPLMIQTGKESEDSLQSIGIFNQDIKRLEEDGCVVLSGPDSSLAYNIKAKITAYSLDRKASNILLGLGGAYCDLCNRSKEECLDISIVNQGIDISRDINEIYRIFEEHQQEDGTIKKNPNDYKTRTGVTSRPITTNQVISVQVLHALMRVCDFYMKLSVHLSAAVFVWTESKTSRQYKFIENAKANLQKKIQANTGIRWDYVDSSGNSGTSTTGNTCRRILHDPNVRRLVTEEIPVSHRETMEELGMRLSVILRVMSSSEEIDTERFKQFCTETNIILIEKFPRVYDKKKPGPWISVTPTVHKILAHSWELIQNNDSRGLSNLDESGMEGCNKIVRSIRKAHSRKISQDANLIDTFRRLWVGSDPKINQIRLMSRPACTSCHQIGHSTRSCPTVAVHTVDKQEDALFKSFCI